MDNSIFIVMKKWSLYVLALVFVLPESTGFEDNKSVTHVIFDFKNETNFNSFAYSGVNIVDGLERTTRLPSARDTAIHFIEKTVIDNANTKQLHLMVPSFAFICVLLVFGLPANIFAIFMYMTKLKKAVARHFIITLAVSDLVTCLIAMPSELDIMTRYFDFDEDIYCKFFRFTAYLTNNISSVTLISIAIERHRILCTPWKRKFTPRIARNICFLTIFVSALYALPMIFMYGTHTIHLGKLPLNISETSSHNTAFIGTNITDVLNDTYAPFETLVIKGKTCSISDKVVTTKFPYITIITYIVTTVIVYVLLSFLYGRIGRSLFIRRRKSVCQQNKKGSTKRARQVTIMGFTLTVVYQICYLPCFILVVLRLAKPTFYGSLSDGGKMLYNVLLKSYLINCSVNPFIYCIFNKSVQQIFFKKCVFFKRTNEANKDSYKISEDSSGMG